MNRTMRTRQWTWNLLVGLLISSSLGRAGAQAEQAFTLPPPADAAQILRFAFYSYDSALPLNAEVKPLDESKDSVRYSLSYDSAHDQRVTAIVALPKRYAAPYPAVILAHGSGGNKDTSYIKLSSELLTKQGFATLAIDAQYRGDRKRPGRQESLGFDTYLVRDAWVQTVIDLRRAIDYLQSRPDIAKNSIGYLGFSMGGMMGSVLGGVEPRIGCFLLAVPGGGLVNMVKNLPKMLEKSPQLKDYVKTPVTPDMIRRVEDIANVIDPIYFVGRILPRPLLIMVATNDEIIPPDSSTALIEAAHAKEGENVKRFPGGHTTALLNPTAIGDIRNFFVTHLGKREPRAAAH